MYENKLAGLLLITGLSMIITGLTYPKPHETYGVPFRCRVSGAFGAIATTAVCLAVAIAARGK